MKTKDWVINGLVAALYVVLTLISTAFGLAYGPVQFRISEVMNHLAVYDKRYIVGIVAGVVVANLFSPMVLWDMIFGVGHSLLALLTMRALTKEGDSDTKKMWVNVASFAIFSFMIAIEIAILSEGEAFWPVFWSSWFTVALGEVVVMALGIPIMKWLNKQIKFERQFT